jgi:RNA polymerase sigma-70 factor (ECF subfamily)
MAGVATKAGAATYEPVVVNGRLGLVGIRDGERFAVLSFTVDGGLVTRIDIVLAPAKLGS